VVVFGLIGTIIGSFLNVCIDRLPAGQSLLRPASYCPACQQRLAPKDLIPVFSYLWLRGRCRYCRALIPQRVLWVEVGTGLMFAFLWWQYGLTPELGIMTFCFCLLSVILVIDLERGLILNKVVYPAAAIALIIATFTSNPGIVSVITGGGLGLGIMLLVAWLYKGGIGWGDVKMGALVGLLTGFPLVLVSLFLSVVGGGLVAGALLLLKIRKRKETIPFGPFLSLGAMVTLLWGTNILDWYLLLF
jgi:leader peptidase (prepilin peptidase)/N-methyltransferase